MALIDGSHSVLPMCRGSGACPALTEAQEEPGLTGTSPLQARTGNTQPPQAPADVGVEPPATPWRSPFETANLLRSARDADADDREAVHEDAGRVQVP